MRHFALLSSTNRGARAGHPEVPTRTLNSLVRRRQEMSKEERITRVCKWVVMLAAAAAVLLAAAALSAEADPDAGTSLTVTAPRTRAGQPGFWSGGRKAVVRAVAGGWDLRGPSPTMGGSSRRLGCDT